MSFGRWILRRPNSPATLKSRRILAVRIHILSDLHLRHHDPPRLDGAARQADVAVLAGDIGRNTDGIAWTRRTFPQVPVVYVAGNHEYYDRHLDATNSVLRRAGPSSTAEDRSAGTYFLERGAVTIGSVRFLGCTFWTGFELFEGRRAEVMRACRGSVDDYQRIHLLRARRPLRPRDTDRLHRTSVRWLQHQLEAPTDPDVRATVVVTHHPPSRWSIDPRYVEQDTSAAFVARRGAFVEQSGAQLWIHGHVHASFDYRLGTTRVLSNPRGHPGENPNFRSGYVVEV